ncbi:MAG: hypothetical protein UU95_C0008G0042 [Parcubacteria group bacterium GW2011_GWC2_42_12]|uniref:Glycosyltransferase RgtA/B/C/D-like domain-containing protein n=2 Tax=Candidatus Falkowiibacteriota TaxID=1752728 RepID=A0A1F5S9M0_9BACT|nr:MAG: hypothetical protein UU95_C0008G0042 [Parcubacteria group bacterium GW2011_GWC2_42_12]OGF23410.1 MAG: hypothetical protein A3D45_01920 [Candidatus Falkowbacteria bacterium RIFCSPHIGHO2_02_FULL_42_9]
MRLFKSLFFKSAMVFLFFFFLFFFTHLLNGQFISSDDPYYHAKHALLIEQSGEINLVEPWLEFHFLNFAPADYWWGFHLGMAIFIHWFGLFLGVEIFASILATLVFLIFYLILNELRVKYPLAWLSFLFFSSTAFIYRLLLERPHLLAIMVLPLAFLLLVKKKNFWLFILSLFYALSYVLAPLIVLQTLIYLAVDFYTNKRVNLRPLIASTAGILAGVIIHPNSLNYLYGMFTQNWLVLFLRLTGVNLGIGSEVQLASFFTFLNLNFLTLLFYILAATLFLSLKRVDRESTVNIFLFLCSSFWLLVTLLVPRGVEYWLPITFIFAAVMFSDFSAGEGFEQAKDWLVDRINFKIIGFFLISLLALVVFYNLGNVFYNLYYDKTGEISANYEQANIWLKANTVEGSLVFYNNFSMWPMMFFYNNYNHYIIGMDPTSTYEYNKQTYWLWRNISFQGLSCDKPSPCFDISPRDQVKLVPLTIKTVFRSKYAVVSNYENSNLIKTLNNLKAQVRLVFKNKDLLIYEMR